MNKLSISPPNLENELAEKKKYRIDVRFDGTETYVVEARNELEARELYYNGDAEPMDSDGDNHEIDGIEEVEE